MTVSAEVRKSKGSFCFLLLFEFVWLCFNIFKVSLSRLGCKITGKVAAALISTCTTYLSEIVEISKQL